MPAYRFLYRWRAFPVRLPFVAVRLPFVALRLPFVGEVANCIRGGGPIWEHPTSPPQENLCAVRGVDPPPRKPPFSSKVRPPPSNTAVLLEYKEPVFYFDDLMSGRGSPQLARTFLYF